MCSIEQSCHYVHSNTLYAFLIIGFCFIQDIRLEKRRKKIKK